MKRLSTTSMLFLVFCLPAFLHAQSTPPRKMEPGAKVYIAPMPGELHTFLAAEIIKKKVPLVVVMEEAEAEFIMTGGSFKTGEGKWYDVMFGTVKDKNEGSVQLISVEHRTLVWAGEAGDRSLWWGAWARGGTRKVAGRIIARLKDDLAKGVLVPVTDAAPRPARSRLADEKAASSTKVTEEAMRPTPTSLPQPQPKPTPLPKTFCAEKGSRVPCPGQCVVDGRYVPCP